MHKALSVCRIVKVKVKVKVKFTLQQAPKAQRRKQMYSSTRFLTSALDGVGGQRHTLADLTLEKPGTVV
jgi:hypothetical protein